MAERQRKSVRKQKTPYDTQNPSNWTRQKLLNELRNLGINCHDSFTKATLKQLYLANLHTQRITIPNDSMDTDTGPTTQETTINQEPSDSTVRENTCVMLSEDSEDTTSTSVLRSMCNMVSETMSSFRTMMSSVMANQGAQERNLTEVNPLNIAMNRLKNGNEAHTCIASEQRPHISSLGLGQQFGLIGNNGMASELLPHMDIISPSVKKQILQGKNVNLASLLIPNFEIVQSKSEISDNTKIHPDPHLSRQLSINEFMTAFGKYKRTMAKAYPERREELDRYEASIIEIANVFPKCFYEYHKLFSAKAAMALEEFQIKVDWSIVDKGLLQLVSAGADITHCELCKGVDHVTHFCPMQWQPFPQFNNVTPSYISQMLQQYGLNSINPVTKNNLQDVQVKNKKFNRNLRQNSISLDRKGRSKISYKGQEICNNFNSQLGCSWKTCTLLHICLKCKSKLHSAAICNSSEIDKSMASSNTGAQK